MLVISQSNLLLCLVNDILDFKLIKENQFIPKVELFKPIETFGFILNMFAWEVKFHGSKLFFKTSPSPLPNQRDDDLNNYVQAGELPQSSTN